jgi:hypothetical protein
MLYHRLVLYEKIGPGQHPCNYCGETVEWKVGQHTQRGNLIAEHVDGDTTNNDPENLVPSCQSCNNRKNSRAVGDDETFIVIGGKRCRAVERTCEQCSKPFLVRVAEKRTNFGRFCSRSCARSFGNLHR